MNSSPGGAPPPIFIRLRAIGLDLPEVREERAWTGVRRNIGRRNFTHGVALDGGWPPGYARVAALDSGCVCTFLLGRQRCAAMRFCRAPFFRPVWFPSIAGVVIDASTDWDKLGSLIRESYRVLAPKKVAAADE